MAFTISQTFFLVYLFVVLTCTAALLSNNEECLALYEFKQTISHQRNDFGRFQKFDSWRKSKSNTSVSDCCFWAGVVCNNKGHVTELDWSESSLTGVINSSSTLFKLVHLQMLNLSMNFFESQIPSEIARLKQLRVLNLSYSQFHGQIPNEISQLIQLSSLDLSGNPLKLQSYGLEYLLKNMTRLEILCLSSVDLSSPVPVFFANFSSLMFMDLSNCELRDEFPSAIFHLPKLKHVNMGNNSMLIGFLPEFRNNSLLEHLMLDLTGFLGIIPESISNLNHLVYLSLESCHFSGHLPGSLPNLTQLTYLSLLDNNFTGFVPSFASLSKLTYLGLGYNSFDKESVYDWINKLTNIKQMNLGSMNMQGEILPYLANQTKLNFFAAEGNFIFGFIPSSLMNLTLLTVLDIEDNQLQGQIPNSFFNLKSLKHLYLSYNNFSGTVGLDSFLGLNKLERLYLAGNSLSFVTTNNYTNETLPELKHLDLLSCNLNEFPSFLRFQNKMEIISLPNNEIKGLVPNWIWNNSQETLQTIDLAGNFITGFHQHPHFLPWISLEVFVMAHNQLQGRLPIPPQSVNFYDVSRNNLTGKIPPWVCDVKSLQVLDFSSNKMTGVLPPCLGNLNSPLSILVLKQNNFHGPMLNACKQGSLFKEIDLSENHFTGPVSKSLANCTKLEFLSLADNSFEDVFPIWLGVLSNLQVLILRSNKFYGAIQGLSTISSPFLKLRIIDVSNNNFSGRLPDKSFRTWNSMKSVYMKKSSPMGNLFVFNTYGRYQFHYSMTLTIKGLNREYEKIQSIFTAIDLSCNNFEGPIPQSLQDLHGLESLNLSNNHFTGHIFPSLGNLKNLESLDLFQNNLSGQIPQQLLQLGFLAFLNMSFNHLNGPIPQGKQFNTFDNNSYMGNPGLCGKPLSRECENSNASTILLSLGNNDYESLLPHNRIDWMVILFGVGSGLVIGTVIGSFVYARNGDWLLERLGMKKDRWVRPLRNTRRN